MAPPPTWSDRTSNHPHPAFPFTNINNSTQPISLYDTMSLLFTQAAEIWNKKKKKEKANDIGNDLMRKTQRRS